MKQGVIIGFLGKTQDRFSEYQQPVSVKEKLEIVKQIEGFDGVEIVFPYETGDAEETKGWMKELELNFAAVNVNIKKEPEWVPGALSRPIKEIRDRAVEMIKKAIISVSDKTGIEELAKFLTDNGVEIISLNLYIAHHAL